MGVGWLSSRIEGVKKEHLQTMTGWEKSCNGLGGVWSVISVGVRKCGEWLGAH